MRGRRSQPLPLRAPGACSPPPHPCSSPKEKEKRTQLLEDLLGRGLSCLPARPEQIWHQGWASWTISPQGARNYTPAFLRVSAASRPSHTAMAPSHWGSWGSWGSSLRSDLGYIPCPIRASVFSMGGCYFLVKRQLHSPSVSRIPWKQMGFRSPFL